MPHRPSLTWTSLLVKDGQWRPATPTRSPLPPFATRWTGGVFFLPSASSVLLQLLAPHHGLQLPPRSPRSSPPATTTAAVVRALQLLTLGHHQLQTTASVVSWKETPPQPHSWRPCPPRGASCRVMASSHGHMAPQSGYIGRGGHARVRVLTCGEGVRQVGNTAPRLALFRR